jgi:hypothetical protein
MTTMAATPWATTADVATLTGITVNEATLRQAVTTLEVQTGLIQDVERVDISDRDAYWLKLAACYQAAWLQAQPDVFERNDVANASQDGESAAFRPDAHTLAPLARKALRRLSWRGPRAVVASTPRRRNPLNVNSEEYDDSLAWKPVVS